MNTIISDPRILAEIHHYIDVADIQQISKGYSIDLKYLLIAKTGEKYLVRITESDDSRVLTARRKQFELIHTLTRYSSRVPSACHFWLADNAHSCVMILTYVDGKDGEESLCRYNNDLQYTIGYQAGEELKKLHQLAAPPHVPLWYNHKRQKHEWYCSEFQKSPLDPSGVDLEVIHAFIKERLHLMHGVTQTFQHDDYHPVNLILLDGNLQGIIDFNRCDWGDPIHDFYKIAYFTRNISIPFARGQIDGYFQKMIPYDFWERYALYCAMSIIPDLVWSGRTAFREGFHDELEKSLHRIRILYHDHDAFSSVIPRWFREG